MNIYELQHRFNLEMEKHGIFDPVPSAIIEDYINYAYQQYITEKFDSLINPTEKFEITERLSRILATLLKDFTTTTFTAITTNSDYGYYVTAPSDLQFLIKERAIVSYTDCNDDTALLECSVIPIKHNRIASNRKNPFLKPEGDEVWRVNFANGTIELIFYESATPSRYTCRYLKKHDRVSFNPVAPATGEMEIDSSVHEEIVVRGAYMYLSDLRNQSNKEEEKENA